MQLSGKKLTTAILAGLMGATMFGGSVFADDAQRLTNVEVLATQNKSNIDTLKNDVQALKDASTKDTYSKDEVDNKLADKANQSDVTTNTNGIATNKQAISDEATARQTADADLQKGVDANKQAISDEATARQTADAGLQKGVDANKQAIADETKARQTDVANLQTNIKDALTNQGIVNDTLTKAVQANSNAIVTSSQNLEKHLKDTDGRVDQANAEIHTNAGNIAQNKQDIATNTANIQKNSEAVAKVQEDYTTVKDTVQFIKDNKDAIDNVNTMKTQLDATTAVADNNHTAIQDEIKQRQTDVSNLQTNIKDALNNQGVVNDTLTKAVQANSNAIVTSSQNLEKHLGETDGRVDKANQQINTNKGDIAQNKADIATNKTDIATNKADIAQNKVDIAQNKTDIATNKTDIATNKADIAQNKVDIAQNKTDIATNKTDIATNKADIAQNKTDIATNKTDIATNKADIAQNKTDIATNKTDIATNKADIAQNKTDIATNKTDIATNKKAINDEAATRQAADQNLQNQINNNSTSINDLYGRYSSLKTDINKVGARSAALAGLHPLDFDPANKLNFAVASGSFKGENSVALGAFYRPNENIMFSAASTMGDSDNAYTFGLSFKIGPSSAKTKTTSPDAEELYKVVGELQDQLAAQQKEIEQLKANKAK